MSASFKAMEEIYANVDSVKPVSQIPVTNNEGSSSSKKRLYFGVFISLGLLNVFLLIGLISLSVYSHDLGSLAASLSDIKDNLTEQRDLLNANLTEMFKEMIRVQRLSKQEKTCPAGWSKFSSSCYLLSKKSGSWDEGREDCRNRGGDLVVIDNAGEQRFLSTFINKEAWIGLNDKETEGSWKWVDGTPLILVNWEESQPDNGGGDQQWGEEDCVHVRTNQKASWNDRLCTSSFLWICEK